MVRRVRDIAGTYAFPSAGKVDWVSRELGSVDPILWDIVFSEQSNKEALYSDIKSILDNHMDWGTVGPKLAARVHEFCSKLPQRNDVS